MKTTIGMLVPAMVLCLQGCIIVDHEDPDCIGDYCGSSTGDIEFFWAFELPDGSVTDECYLADVATMDVFIYDDFGDLEFRALDRPCEDMGAIIDNFYPGGYELELVATCRTGRITHEGWWYLDVYEGTNDFGTLTLSYLGPCR